MAYHELILVQNYSLIRQLVCLVGGRWGMGWGYTRFGAVWLRDDWGCP
jgi:hypothetical protein